MPRHVTYDEGALERIRKERGLSREDLAERADLSDRAIAYLEKGTVPRATTLAKIAAALDADITEFFTPPTPRS